MPSELAAYMDVSEKTVKQKAQLLKGMGLLRSSRDGYYFTPKGVKFIRKWFSISAANLELEVPEVPVPKVKRGAQSVPNDSLRGGLLAMEPPQRVSPLEEGTSSTLSTFHCTCEVCGRSTETVVVREDGEHWICDKCLRDWKGKL
jgi:hypothetical protein